MSSTQPDQERARQMHAFCTDRALERMAAASARRDRVGAGEAWRGLRVLDTVYAEARRRPDTATYAAGYLRRRALQDRDHEAFRVTWVLAERVPLPRRVRV